MNDAGVEGGVFITLPAIQDGLIFGAVARLSRSGSDYERSPGFVQKVELRIYRRIKWSHVTIIASVVFLEVVDV